MIGLDRDIGVATVLRHLGGEEALVVDAGGQRAGAVGEGRVLEVALVEEIHHQAHIAAAAARRAVGGAAAFFLLAFEQHFAAGFLDDILVVAQHFERRALGRQHIGDAGQRAFDLGLLSGAKMRLFIVSRASASALGFSGDSGTLKSV